MGEEVPGNMGNLKEVHPVKEKGQCQVKVVETPVFVPYTLDSNLKRRLQELDDKVLESTGSPAVRFVERCGGGTIIDLLGR